MKKNLFVLVVIAFLFCFKTNAQESLKNFEGPWVYTCNDAPYGYQSGTLIIEHKGNKYIVKVVYEDGSVVNAQSLKVENDILYFNVNVENESVDVQLKKEGGKLKGKAINNYGEELLLTAVKKVK
ncbi:hypothetical protein [Aestuariivivens marinum]|uniref:hypothetical protein n=1 Tax=Aestuariivivens marinum TaxID=2913555 RepID=UPI001F566970|nr:hypothetical protein [Aestuariivivens marinum]